MATTIADDLKDLLHQQGRLRVWSIIATIMGDVVETMGGDITIAELITICTNLDIEPQAVRTAMSRLTKEGWVDRMSDGRGAGYKFSHLRRGEFNDATRYIYAPPSAQPDAWRVGILPLWPQAQKRRLIAEMSAAYPIIINQHMVIWQPAHDKDLPEDCRQYLTIFDRMPLTMPAAISNLDEALPGQISPSPQASLITTLVSYAGAALREDITPKDALIIRIILMHFWRRLVLRHAHVHAPFDDNIWPLPRLHQAMAAVYPKLASVSAPALPHDADMNMIEQRFS